MKQFLLLTMISFATAASLMGQTAQEIAAELPSPTLNEHGTQLVLPQVEGAVVELGGVDYAEIIHADGSVQPVISDTPVQVFLKVTKDGEEALSKDYVITVPGASAQGNAKPRVIPEILQWQGGQGEWTPGKEIRIRWACPCKAEMFARDLRTVMGAEVRIVGSEEQADIVMELTDEAAAPYGSEGYKMEVNAEEGVRISAAADKGLYWGSRTLLQILRAHGGSAPCGIAVDFPRYGLRGFMLDIARTHYTLGDLRNVIDTMAWFKMNDLHLVINNNFIFHERYVDAGRDPFKESYSAFRLESKMQGADGTPLTASDVFYTKKQFRDLIDYAKARGVNIVPEFDTPGHALSFTRVRPDLIYKGPMRYHEKRRCEMLDAANPETLQFISTVFDEYLLPDEELKRPVFEGCVMHVGADEFFGHAEDYRKYMDGLLHIVLERGYTPRVWGSLTAKPGETPVAAKGVQMNLWNGGWMSAWEAVKLGYDVINTNDGHLYIVPFANYYRMDLNHKWVYNNWKPNVIGGETLPAGHPQLLGATFAVWNDKNDILHSGYGMYDIWETISGSIDVLSQKMWGVENAPDSFEQHRELVAQVGEAPGIDPLHKAAGIPEGELIAGVGLPAELGKPGVGPGYHLTVELELKEAPAGEEQVLLSGPEGELIAVMKDGSVGFRRADTMEFSYDAKLPVGERVKLELIGQPGQTKLLINGKPVRKITLNNYTSQEENFNKRTKGVMSTFVLPLQTVGKSLRGAVYSLTVTPN